MKAVGRGPLSAGRLSLYDRYRSSAISFVHFLLIFDRPGSTLSFNSLKLSDIRSTSNRYQVRKVGLPPRCLSTFQTLPNDLQERKVALAPRSAQAAPPGQWVKPAPRSKDV